MEALSPVRASSEWGVGPGSSTARELGVRFVIVSRCKPTSPPFTDCVPEDQEAGTMVGYLT